MVYFGTEFGLFDLKFYMNNKIKDIAIHWQNKLPISKVFIFSLTNYFQVDSQRKLKSKWGCIRQAALLTLKIIIKNTTKRDICHYWKLFLPSGKAWHWLLISVLFKDGVIIRLMLLKCFKWRIFSVCFYSMFEANLLSTC